MINLKTHDWEIKDVKAILFDKDGTFISSHIYWGEIIRRRVRAVMDFYTISDDFFEELCLSMGLDCNVNKLIPEGPIALLARDAVIKSLKDKLKSLNISAKSEDIEQIFKDVHKEFLPEIYDSIELITEARDFFVGLKQAGVKMAVVTSDTRANTEAILEYLNLNQYFDLVIGKDDCKMAKKTGEPALVALSKLNVNAKNTISVGDASMDYEMAKNANLAGSILVATGQTPLKELKTYTNTVVESLKEVQIEH